MEAPRATHDREVDYPEGRFRLLVFEDIRVALVAGAPRAQMGAVAMETERSLDVRFYGSSWRLVLADEGLHLVTFRGYDRNGALRDPELLPAPPAMAWLADAPRMSIRHPLGPGA